MDANELQSLMVDLESDLVERKESISSKEKICQAICAFSNDLPAHGKPGILFIGVDDKGNPTGLRITDQLLLDLGALKSDGRIQPLPTMSVEKHVLSGKDVAVIVVHPSYSPPVRFDGRVWIRAGPRRALASPDDERRLIEKRRHFDLPFDQRPIRGAALNNINIDYFCNTYLKLAIASDVLEQNQRTTGQQLASLRFMGADASTPTAAGLLVLGLDPQEWIPGAYVEFVRFDGTNATTAIKSSKRLDGLLGDIASGINDYIPLQIETARPQATTMKQEDIPDYPWRALRELIFNAVIHRNYESSNAPVRINWYSDRVEIQNPGGLFGQTTPQNFEFTTDYRNKVVAEAMKVLGYVERFGIGISRAKAMLAANGNPPPEFQFYPEQTLVIVRRRA